MVLESETKLTDTTANSQVLAASTANKFLQQMIDCVYKFDLKNEAFREHFHLRTSLCTNSVFPEDSFFKIRHSANRSKNECKSICE